MSSHEEEQEYVTLYALGALNERDAQIARTHLESCAACRQELTELRELVGIVAFAAEAAADEHALRLARIKRTLLTHIGARSNRYPLAGETPVIRFADASRVRRLAAPQMALVAACIALVIVGSWAFVLGQRLQSANLALETAHAQTGRATAALAQHERLVALLAQPGATRYEVPGGFVVRSNDAVYLAIQTLPPLPAGRVYQAWTLAAAGGALHPERTFRPNANGLTLIELAERGRVAALGLTVEPRGGSLAPTSKPLFLQRFG